MRSDTPEVALVSPSEALDAFTRTLAGGARSALVAGALAGIAVAAFAALLPDDPIFGRFLAAGLLRAIALPAFSRAAQLEPDLLAPGGSATLGCVATVLWAPMDALGAFLLLVGVGAPVAILPDTEAARLCAAAGGLLAVLVHATVLFPRYAVFCFWNGPQRRRRLRFEVPLLVAADAGPIGVAVVASLLGASFARPELTFLPGLTVDATWIACGVLWCALAATANALIAGEVPAES